MPTEAVRMLRWRAVCAARGCSRSKLYADIKDGLFPPPVQLGLRAVGWPETDILAEQEARVAARDAKGAEAGAEARYRPEAIRRVAQKAFGARSADGRTAAGSDADPPTGIMSRPAPVASPEPSEVG